MSDNLISDNLSPVVRAIDNPSVMKKRDRCFEVGDVIVGPIGLLNQILSVTGCFPNRI